MSRLLAACDGLSEFCGRLSALMVIAVGFILSYEVILRYFFLAPTSWAQDISLTMQVWFTYLALGYVLRHREMIRIAAVIGYLGPLGRKIAEGFALVVILVICVLVVWLGSGIVEDSVALGRRQPTILELPNWLSELPVVIGFVLLGLQALADLIRLPFRPAPDFKVEEAV